MTIENSNNEWCTTGRNGEEFYAIKQFSALNANDPKHVEMAQAIADAFVAFPKNVQARKQQIAKSFTKLVVGAAITAAEIDALRHVVKEATGEAD